MCVVCALPPHIDANKVKAAAAAAVENAHLDIKYVPSCSQTPIPHVSSSMTENGPCSLS